MQYLFLIAILPVIVLLLFVYFKDSKKEPKKLLASTFALGALSSIVIVIIELIIEYILPSENGFFSIFIGVALVEEGFKWLVVKRAYKKPVFDETYDGIVYAVFSSLGFAAVENLLFVLFKGMGTGILRALTAVPGHAYYAIIMGYYFGLAKRNKIDNNKSEEKKNLFISILIPTLLHTIYDSLLIENILSILIWLIFIFSLSIFCIIFIFKASKKNSRYQKNNYCTNCGNYIEGKNYCTNCGTRNE